MYRELFLKLRQSVGLGILNRFIYSSHKVNVRNRHYLELLADFDRKSALLRGFYAMATPIAEGPITTKLVIACWFTGRVVGGRVVLVLGRGLEKW